MEWTYNNSSEPNSPIDEVGRKFYKCDNLDANGDANDPDLAEGRVECTGPWALRGYQIRANDGLGQSIGTYYTCAADGRLMAAAPVLYEMLVSVLDNLDESTARDFRARLISMGIR